MTSQNPYESSSPPTEILRAHPLTAICDVLAIIFAGLPLLLLAVVLLSIGPPKNMVAWQAGYIFLLLFAYVIVLAFYAFSVIYNLVGGIMGRRMPFFGLLLNALTFGVWALQSWLH